MGIQKNNNLEVEVVDLGLTAEHIFQMSKLLKQPGKLILEGVSFTLNMRKTIQITLQRKKCVNVPTSIAFH